MDKDAALGWKEPAGPPGSLRRQGERERASHWDPARLFGEDSTAEILSVPGKRPMEFPSGGYQIQKVASSETLNLTMTRSRSLPSVHLFVCLLSWALPLDVRHTSVSFPGEVILVPC